MEHPMRRRPLVAATIISAIGFAVGIGYRFFIDNAGERELVNYLRSGLYGVGIALAGWAVQNTVGPNARSSLGAALRRLPLLRELVVRSLGMTFVIVIVGVALQFVLYAEPYRLQWFTGLVHRHPAVDHRARACHVVRDRRRHRGQPPDRRADARQHRARHISSERLGVRAFSKGL